MPTGVDSIAAVDNPAKIIEASAQLTDNDIKAAMKFDAEVVNNADFNSRNTVGWTPVQTPLRGVQT